MNYASPTWAPMTSTLNITKLQTVQNTALLIVTGCTRPTGAQTTHATISMTDQASPERKKSGPISYYKALLDSLLPTPENKPDIDHIHKELTKVALLNKPDNKIQQAQPSLLSPIETVVPRFTRTTLSQLRSGKHPSLNTFKNLLDPAHSTSRPSCPDSKQTTQHMLLHCPVFESYREQFSITFLLDLWTDPISCI